MYWRSIRSEDLDECLQMQQACIGDAIVGREAAMRTWNDLTFSPAFHASIIESEHPIGGHRVVACGLGVFVDRTFIDRELQSPRPDINSRIIASVSSGRSVVLDRDAIAIGNAGDGLDFVNLYGTWRSDITDSAMLAEIHALLGTSFVENIAGYRFNRIVKEAVGRPAIDFARATGTYRIFAEFPEHGSALAVVAPDSARTAPYSYAAGIYRYHAPVLRLRPAEQGLLAAALNATTDAELSKQLNISVQAIKKRWLSVFSRVERYKPEIVSAAQLNGERRGPQKRHRIVAYVRAHREELTPYAWGPS